MTRELKMSAHPFLLAIVGPTATGKSLTAVEVAKMLNGEIVSADSMLVYRYMDIGTAKPTMEERQGIPHYMIDIIDPDEPYSVALYQAQAEKHIQEIENKGKLPILVGGTGLYIRSVIDNYYFTGTGVNTELRKSLEQEAELYGREAVYRRLAREDPQAAARLHPNDLKRVIRALEVYLQTGRSIIEFENMGRLGRPKYRLAMFGLTMDRNHLYQQIEKRVDEMVEKGLVEEVEQLLQRGYGPELTSMQGLGYKEIISYLQRKFSFDEAIYLLKRNTRRFAKRQFTWFNRDKRVRWINVEAFSTKIKLAQAISRNAAGLFKDMSK